MNTGCLICGGSFKTVLGDPCPNCTKDMVKTLPICPEIPAQYQGVRFDKTFLPKDMQETYGTYMENLLNQIIGSAHTYQKNLLICSRPNSGRTIWSYNLYSLLTNKGIKIPSIKDIFEVKEILTQRFGDPVLAELWSSSRFAIIKIPQDVQAWMWDSMTTIIERRVRANGCTIFFYNGSRKDLKNQDTFGKLRNIEGQGSYNTVEVKSFFIQGKGE